MIRKLDKAEFQQATTLALEVYLQCGQDDFEDEGLESFKSFIFNDKLMNELCIYGAFEENKLIGIMGTKNEGKHISLFFINFIYELLIILSNFLPHILQFLSILKFLIIGFQI